MRHARSAAAIALAAVCAVVGPLVAGLISSGGTPRLFPASAFDRPVPAGLALAPTSTAFSRDLVDDYRSFYGSVGVNELPIWSVPSGQPTVRMEVSTGCNDFLHGTGASIPIPGVARPGGGTDSDLVVSQPSTDTEWEFWRARRLSATTWTACWGGKLGHRGSSDGVFPSPYGLAASGISYLATAITEDEVASGTIAHALAVELPRCDPPQVPPADHSDCATDPGGEPDQPREGTWYRMPGSVAMPKGLTPYGRMVFTALQTYGMVVTDYAGAVALVSESTTDWAAEGHKGVDPITASWAGHAEYDVLEGIPWGDLVVTVPRGAG